MDRAKTILITSPKRKEKLVKAFEDAGAVVVNELSTAVNLIIPTVDEELPFFSRNKLWFESLGINVMVSSPETIDTCRDKAEFYRFCRRHDIPTPGTMQDNLVIKPRFGKGSHGVMYIDRGYVVQERCAFPEYSVDYFGSDNGKCLSVVCRKRLDIVDGESTRAEICTDDVLVNISIRLGEELKLIGHNTIQCFYYENRILFSEVNCRFGGGFWLTQHIYPTVKNLVESCA